MEIELSELELKNLLKIHRQIKSKKDADRIKSIILLNKGFSVSQVSEILLIDDKTIRRNVEKYKNGGLSELMSKSYRAYTGKLFDYEIEELKKELDSKIYRDSNAVCVYILEVFGVHFTDRGCRNLLHRIGYVYKKPVGVPCKADVFKQIEFVNKYRQLRETQKADEVILFTDATHPTHNSVPTHGWIRKGENRQLLQNTGRGRVNIIGSVDIKTKEMFYTMSKTVNSDTFIEHLNTLIDAHPNASLIRVITDNAKYIKNEKIFNFLRGRKIYIEFIPVYSPNMNLIERVWKLMKKVVKRNNYIDTFKGFKTEILKFLSQTHTKYLEEMKTLLTENFQLIDVHK